MESAIDGNLQVVRDLLGAGANVNAQGSDGRTALFVASQEGHLEVIKLLLQTDKVDVNLQTTNGETALHASSLYGHLEVVRELLQNNKVDVNLQTTNGATALHASSLNGSDGWTALILACQQGHVEVVRELLQNNKVDVNLQTTDGATALHVVTEYYKPKVVSLLLEHDNLDVNSQDAIGATALHIASAKGRVDIVEMLLQNNNVDVKLKNEKGSTAGEMGEHDVAVRNAFRNHRRARLFDLRDRDLLEYAMTMRNTEPVELRYRYIKRCVTKIKLGSGAFGDVFLAEDSELPEPKKFAVKTIKHSPRSNDKNLKSFQKELSVRSGFCRECCIVWNNAPCTHLPRVLTIMHNSARH